MELVGSFAQNVHIDFSDGVFAPNALVKPIQAWYTEGLTADLHVMYVRPEDELHTLISMQPRTIIFHAESEGDIAGLMLAVKQAGIRAGIALLADTQPESCQALVEQADHVLIFSGHLGYHGGVADLNLLGKVETIKQMNLAVEFGWDGGINDENVEALADGGISVLNVGGFIHKSDQPQKAYAILEAKLKIKAEDQN